MKSLILVLALSGSLAGLAHAETRDLTGFTEVHASGRFRVEVSTGDRFSVVAEGPDAARVRTTVERGALVVEPRNRPWFGSAPRLDAVVRVTVPLLEGVSSARGMMLTADASGACEHFSANAAMGAGLDVSNLTCRTVEAAAAMGAEVELAGTCAHLEASAAMGGNIQAGSLVCQRAEIDAAMGGAVSARASESYDASAAMGGAINLAGAPQQGDRSSAMGGSITIAN